MTTALVACALGTAEVDLDEDVLVAMGDEALVPDPEPRVELPLLVAVAGHGSTVVAIVERRPPLVVSNDGGTTWREAGAGLGPGVAIAISPEHPDVMLYATAERLHVSRNGGTFWSALAVELPGIRRVRLLD